MYCVQASDFHGYPIYSGTTPDSAPSHNAGAAPTLATPYSGTASDAAAASDTVTDSVLSPAHSGSAAIT